MQNSSFVPIHNKTPKVFVTEMLKARYVLFDLFLTV